MFLQLKSFFGLNHIRDLQFSLDVYIIAEVKFQRCSAVAVNCINYLHALFNLATYAIKTGQRQRVRLVFFYLALFTVNSLYFRFIRIG